MEGLNTDVKTRRLAQQRHFMTTFNVCHFHIDIGVTGCGNACCIQPSHNRLDFVNTTIMNLIVCFLLAQQPQWARASSFTRFLDHTKRCNTVGRTPPEE
jgi:hypothetical protein